VAPYGGAAFHDNHVALERVGSLVSADGFDTARPREPAVV
jgi:hypothetical protein